MVRWQDVNKKLVTLLSTGGIGVVGLLTYLFLLTGVDYTYTGDSACNGLECEAHINVTTSYWTVCFEHPSDSQRIYLELEGDTKLQKTTIGEHPETVVYKKATRGRTLWVNLNNVDNVIKTEPEIPVDWLVPARGKDNWRELKDGDCWSRGKVNKIKLVGHANKAQVIKWNFELDGGMNISIDPLWISYDYIYENLSREVPIYKDNLVVVKPVYFSNNDTWTEGYNYTTKEIIGYETVYYDGDKLGLEIGDKTINHGNVNIKDDKLVEWYFDIGDRNFEEFGECREYEVSKGACTETDILEVVKIK